MSERTPQQIREAALIAEAEQMAAAAAAEVAAGTLHTVCRMGEPVFWLPADHAVRPGHIYSESGVAEYRMSQACEFHFDLWFAEPDEEEDSAGR